MLFTMFETPKRHVDRVFIHCSASDDPHLRDKTLVKEIRKWHMDPNRIGGPFSDIGYHFLIDKAGNVMVGRDLNKQPAAQAPYNRKTIAICIHGLNNFPQPMLDSLARFCHQINKAYSGVIAFWPHNAVSNKSCLVIDITLELRLDKWRRMS